MRLHSPSNPKPAWSAEVIQRARRLRQAGLSLIEMMIAITIIGMASAGIALVYNQAVRGSADPLVRKQALSIAESLLNEVLSQPFTYCDPQDAANDATPAPSSTASCTGG